MTLINSYVTAYTQDIQVSTMPTANIDNLGRVVQFVGTTTSTYTNGYFYKCISDGAAEPTYSWTNINVQAQGDSLPSQSGQSGKFLTTDGTDASWGTINALQNTATHETSLVINAYSNPTTTADNTVCIKGSVNNGVRGAVAVGTSADVRNSYGVSIGNSAVNYANASGGIAIGFSTENYKSQGISIGYQARTNALYSIQIGSLSNNNVAYNPDDYTFKVANGNGNYEMLSADGTIPEDRLASTSGTSTGDVLQLDNSGNAIWAPVSGGGSSLPDMTGQSGKFLTTDGTDASWATVSGGGQTIQVDTLPTASSSNVGTIYQYIGNSGTYKKGYFYISSKNEAVGTATVTKSSSSITSVSVTASTFLQKALQYPQHDHSGANVFVYDEMEWCWLLQPEKIRVSAESFPGETNNLAAWGITVSPEYAMPADGDTITVNYTTGTITYAWNESPTTSFSNSALAAHSLTLQEATPTSSNYCMNIGYNASINTNSNYSIAMGTNCRIESNCGNSIAIGAGTEVQCVNTSGRSGEAVAIGSNIQVDGTGVAIGTNVYTANGGIVLGCEKYNYDPLSPYEDSYFRLAFGATHAYNVLNGKTGLILPDRIASTSGLADGNYRPRLVVSDGVGTIEWVAE